MTKRICINCQQEKTLETDFYVNKGNYRNHCKKCVIKKVQAYNRCTIAPEGEICRADKRKSYMQRYCEENKEKFKEYHKKFLAKRPGYYRQYYLYHKYKNSDSPAPATVDSISAPKFGSRPRKKTS